MTTAAPAFRPYRYHQDLRALSRVASKHALLYDDLVEAQALRPLRVSLYHMKYGLALVAGSLCEHNHRHLSDSEIQTSISGMICLTSSS
jgi:hypothetical protein